MCSNFCGLNVLEDGIECECFKIISIDPLLAKENKYVLQVYLDNCSYKFVNIEILDYVFLSLISFWVLEMLYYDRSEGIDTAKSNNSKESMVCHYWYFNQEFKLQNFVCKGCHDLIILCLNLSDIAIITVKNVDYHCIFMILANLTEFICYQILSLMNVGIHKTHVNIKNQICNSSSSLIKSLRFETEIF